MDDAVPGPGSRPVAYRNPVFLTSADARPLRMLAEYLEPLKQLREQNIHDTVVFFGSARLRSSGPLGHYYEHARTLARLITNWSQSLQGPLRRFVVCSGGGPGIMEAANRGAADAGGQTLGLNIGLPHEQRPNSFITPELSFEFHYFFMRKFWFAYIARALVVFPGGFGTLDELGEILTLSQTGKLARRIPILLYGSAFWKEVLNFDALARYQLIDEADLNLFRMADTPEAALEILQQEIKTCCATEHETETPAFACACDANHADNEARA